MLDHNVTHIYTFRLYPSSICSSRSSDKWDKNIKKECGWLFGSGSVVGTGSSTPSSISLHLVLWLALEVSFCKFEWMHVCSFWVNLSGCYAELAPGQIFNLPRDIVSHKSYATRQLHAVILQSKLWHETDMIFLTFCFARKLASGL